MPRVNIVVETNVVKTPRVLQLEGIFDVPPSDKSFMEWAVDFELPESWNVGVIVGPSGSGKTTVARHLFGDCLYSGFDWDSEKSILDGFPKNMSVKEISRLLSSVGFSSPPSWVRPFRVLSNGEQFRVTMARMIAEHKNMFVIDEFTSVVDRTVAQIGSAAIAKTVRERNQKFIAVSCHYDILDWLQPDFVYQPATGEFFSGRWLHQRPEICLEIQRVHSSAWELFRKHHYLDTSLNKSAACFLATWNNVPVAFTAVLHFPHATVKNIKRESRTVCLPDYQGVGIGNTMSNYIGSLCKGLGFRYMSQTSHPAMIRNRAKSKNWQMKQSPTLNKAQNGSNSTLSSWSGKVRKRLVASFEYTGPALEKSEAMRIWNL